MIFKNEKEFEDALVLDLCTHRGWEKEILEYKTEDDLLKNWADILYNNNRTIDRLGDYPLTDGEMRQIIDQINTLKTPLKLNSWVNGKTISIKRDNPDDKAHLGKEVSLKIYDRSEIAGGKSRYQIARQPRFKRLNKLANDRRGDVMLLINGMPLIHIELKNSDIQVMQAANQIEKYSKEGIFTGLFSLVQIFVAMTPEETLYFANPGMDGKFNRDFYFHWADKNNEPVNNWQQISETLLSIPMAHMLIGFYTIADNNDGLLKVLRSYQYYAAHAISDKVAKTKWADKQIYGGYIWHTTGSGKTMTSFKSAQLIASSKDADKVVFLMDRIELGTQSLIEYRGFAADNESVQETEDSYVLLSKLKSDDTQDTLIVTSIQKMKEIREENAFNQNDINKINTKRIVFIVDECHRSTFGEMLADIKKTFPRALYFGFTGTPILEENMRNGVMQSDVFGDELHRYSISDGIREKNVLGFDPEQISTFKDKDLRKAIALEQCRAQNEDEVFKDESKKKIYNYFMHEIPMAGLYENVKYIKGIEDYIPKSQYERQDPAVPSKHQIAVVENILDNWNTLSQGFKFHAIFATNSIKEACEYYYLIKEMDEKRNSARKLKLTCLFDPSIDNNGDSLSKEKAMIDILGSYNEQFGMSFDFAGWARFKKDVSLRLSHKKTYRGIEKTSDKELDLLIVVNQMLTGFDSKWINTLYLDKELEYENIVQAFSRTNRIFGYDKPHGIVRYYRKPFTMTKNIEKAFELYSGNKPYGVFVSKLRDNLLNINKCCKDIKEIFTNCNISNFEKNPEKISDIQKFVVEFQALCRFIESAKIQMFTWDRLVYGKDFKVEPEVKVELTEEIFNILMERYKELTTGGGGGGGGIAALPYDIDASITELDIGKIDKDYLDSKFKKWIQFVKEDSKEAERILSSLHESFAVLNQEEQKWAEIIIRDIQSGTLKIEENKTFKDYINEYSSEAKNDRIKKFSVRFGLDEQKLRDFMKIPHNEQNINEFGRFDEIAATLDKGKAKDYFKGIPPYKIKMSFESLLREFVLKDGFDLE